MDNIEKMMIENREAFMDQEPDSGHFARFEQRLARQNKRKKNIRLTYRISRIAAVGLLMLMSSLWAYNEFIRPENKTMALGDVSQEYREVEYFLTSQIDSKYEALENCTLLNDEPYKEAMLVELNQMDSVYVQLEEEMSTNPGDERIVEAMIRHYQTKLKVMTDILIRLESFQKQNNSKSNNPNQYESVEL